MPLQQTSGNVTADAYGGGVAVEPVYIESIFSTYLYTGNGSTQTITNGIDLSTKGGLVWAKIRDQSYYHGLSGPTFLTSYFGGPGGLRSNATNALGGTDFSGVTSTGYTLGNVGGDMNFSAGSYVSWTFRKQPKFFDVVTYTGTGANTTIAHNLGSVPGSIIVKRTDTTGDWQVYHGSLANTQYMVLNTTAAVATGATRWNSTTPTSAVFSVGTDASVNASGGTYVAYVFASNAGGFGLTGTDNVISCGSYTGTGAVGNSVTLGYEPQWLMVKNVTSSNYWVIYDNMRGMPASDTNTGNTKFLRPNTSDAEAGGITIAPTATGFQVNTGGAAVNTTGDSYIYIAIRRGPMKVPTDGTKVFAPVAYTGTGAAGQTLTGTSFPPDLSIFQNRPGFGGAVGMFVDRLRGGTAYLPPSSTAAEGNTAGYYIRSFNMDGITYGTSYVDYNYNTSTYINWLFGRAPSFFDEVCYTGTGSARTFTHNLAAVPEMMIVKRRDLGADWWVYTAATGNTQYLVLNSNTNTATASGAWNNTTPTASVFSVGSSNNVNASAGTFVAYLFATCAGVSKVGSYTGNGSTQTIDCGFTGGARFVLIKRTDDFSGWYVYDTARGMTTLTDPYLLLNSTAAESATLGSVTTVTTGFAVNASILAAINTNGASYIYLSIA